MTNSLAKERHAFITATLALFALVNPAASQTPALFGTLSNFDVFNDTGQETHGFEIELDGITSKDVSFTFGSPYQRYGNPILTDFAGGVFVRYQSSYDSAKQSFTTGTPIPPAITPTAGHSCWTGGAPGYLTSGCEHFGMALFKTARSATYHWLIADPATPSVLKPFGISVSIAVPAWTVSPAPVAGGAPIVQANLPPPEAPPAQFGNAVWVKVFENEVADQVELHHLVTDDPAVPQNAAQMETEWALSQSNPKKPDRAVLHHGKPLGKGNQSVIRRYEFYKYTGAYHPLTHEAICGGGECKTPGAGDIGDYIGAQMAAVHIGPAAVPKVTIRGVSNNASGEAAIASGSWVSIYGSDLSATTRQWQDSDFAGNNLPTILDGVSVTINGKAAAVSYISPGQLNVKAPTDSATGPVPVQVTNANGSATGTATLQQYSPAFFTFNGHYAAAVHTDGVYVAPPTYFGGAVISRPAQPGEILLIYGTGFGLTAPAVPSGQIVVKAAPLADPALLHIRIGGVPAEVQYAGIVAAGEYQFNVVVPAVPDGDQPIIADMGGVNIQSGLSIAIKR